MSADAPHPLLEPTAPRRLFRLDSKLSRGLFPIVAVGGALALTLSFRIVVERTIYVFFYGAVIVAALVGGMWAGVGAILLSVVLANYFLLAPDHQFALLRGADAASTIAFAAVATGLSLLAESQRRARHDAADRMRRIAEQAAELANRQEETEVQAEELEQANAELESAVAAAEEARAEAEAREQKLRLLDAASTVLSSSLEYERTIESLAQLTVPDFADWCGVDLLVDGAIRHLAIAHVDPEKVRWARELNARYPVDPKERAGVPEVIRTGEAQFVPKVTDEMLVAGARDADHLHILREVGIYSAIIVPLTARGRTMGALSLVSSRPSRIFTEEDLTVARELGRRAATAIDNAQLYQAALAANESKANFLATMSHELRTPLTAIIGYDELLAEGITGPITDAQKNQLDRIKASATHLLSLIDEILSYARIEAGRESVRVEPAVAKGVVDDAVAFVTPMAQAKGVALEMTPTDPALMLKTDAGKLRQVLVNLLSNAVKFTERGGKVTVSVTSEMGSVVRFDVTDTGIGISPENIDQIFDVFWQVEQHTTRKAGGSGLGLSVSRRLAQLLGGEITVKSEVGKGSTFTVRVPQR